MKTKNFYRHGDIPLYPVQEMKGEIINHNGSFVLALGEATGHHHKIVVDRPDQLVIMKDEKGYYLRLLSDGKLTHEEHKTLVIPKGDYRVGKEREYDHFAHAIKRVVD